MTPEPSSQIHKRCGKRWDEHQMIMIQGWLEVPMCEDEVAEIERRQSGDDPRT